MSRHPLEIVFKREVGRTIKHEITRIRLEKVKELLRRSDLSVTGIAAATGFSRPNHLHRVFRADTGISPREFQQKMGRSNGKR